VTVRLDGQLLNIRAPAGFDRPVGERCAVRPALGQAHLFDMQSGDALAQAGARGPSSAGEPARAGI
jgi:hypothetical protein